MCSISRLSTQLATPVHFCGEYTSVLTPFAVSADKDTVKHRANEMLKLKNKNSNTSEPAKPKKKNPGTQETVHSLCNKRHELAENFLSLILINLVPKVASNCE